MKRFLKMLLAGMSLSVLLSGCGQDPEMTKFKNDIDNFCNSLVELDTAINNIDPNSDHAIAQLLEYLDEVDMRFKNFAELDFPTEFDYLEEAADTSAEYMSNAVATYKVAYSNGSYNEYKADDANRFYAAALDGVNTILAYLHGTPPTGNGSGEGVTPE